VANAARAATATSASARSGRRRMAGSVAGGCAAVAVVIVTAPERT
jgi:hypothetical protein